MPVSDTNSSPRTMSRRHALRLWGAVPMGLLLSACAGAAAQPTTAPAPTQAPTSAPAPTAAPTQVPTSAPAAQAAPATIVAPTATAAPTLPPAPMTVGPTAAPAPNTVLAATPACGDDDDPTPAQTEGPYFTANSPQRTSLLEAGTGGTKLVLSGYVFSTTCQPVSRALVDFWQADDAGAYDNRGYRFRGHQFTDAQGRYTLETVLPGLYPGRTRHIHVKVQAPNRPVLTTQLYFPNEARNRSDGIFHQDLVIDMQDDGTAKAGTFNFVLRLA